jgi:hypothetical protein
LAHFGHQKWPTPRKTAPAKPFGILKEDSKIFKYSRQALTFADLCPPQGNGSIAVSPNGLSITLVKLNQIESDLVSVENFQ